MTTDPKITQDIMIILDASGSMVSMGDEPVQAVNAFIDEQKKTLDKDGSTFSLWTFNSNVKKVIDDVPLHDIDEFKDYKPESMTALYDAIGEAINNKKKKEKYDDVVCVILTDGLENSSKVFNISQIKSMIKDMETNHNWKFAVGGDMGMQADCCSEYRCEPGEMIGATREVSKAVSSYRTRSATDGKEAKFTLKDDRKFQSAPPNLNS
jgi:hypothetical protein